MNEIFFVSFLIDIGSFFFSRFSVSLFRNYFDNTWSSFKQDDHGINISYNVKKNNNQLFFYINKNEIFIKDSSWYCS
jgi:hypothetical protein